MKKIKMIGLDLDGTLLNSKKEVTDHTKSVLEEAIAQGIIVLVATGRPLTGIPGQVRAIQGMQYALTTNGARIMKKRFFRIRFLMKKERKRWKSQKSMIHYKRRTLTGRYMRRKISYRKFGVITRIRICGSM